ncbi:hypothetical protein K1T71_005158 [Dendrolimus kikuchii]|uniref:Uncharacterized protein n=1 Tax=Dendrolimus kikuchii TaxID=765133 RepID=A0ACC1D668_9NEOP|nr:hypothetical protein K1T71_005158 [Dendrolimus kikuchii]
MVEHQNIENLTVDILDDDFVNIFKPILFVQRVMGTLRINIKHGFVTNTSLLYKIYSFLIWIVNTFAIIDYTQHCAKQFDVMIPFSPVRMGTLLYFAASAIVAWRNNIWSKERNCQLYVKLQKLERALRMKNAKTLNKKLALISFTINLLYIILLIIFIIIVNLLLLEKICLSTLLTLLSVLGCFYENCLSLIIMQFINVRVRYFNDVLRKEKCNTLDLFLPNFTGNVIEVCEKIPDYLVSSMFYILEAQSDFMYLYQYSVYDDHRPQLCIVPALISILALLMALCFVGKNLTSQLRATEQFCRNFISLADEAVIKSKCIKYKMPSSAVEYVSEDILEKEFVESFQFALYFQMFLGTCRVNSKDRFVTSPTTLQKFYSISLTISTAVMNCYAIHLYFPIFFSYDHRVYYLRLATSGLDFIVFLLNIMHVRFFNLDENSNFYIHLQGTDRALKIDKVNFVYRTLRRLNVFSTVILIIVIVFLVGFTMALSDFNVLPFLGILYCNFSFLFEVMYCSNILVYFIIRIRFINAIIKNHIDPDNVIIFTIKKPILNEKNIRCIAARTHDFISTDLYNPLRELFYGFTKFQNIYRLQVL